MKKIICLLIIILLSGCATFQTTKIDDFKLSTLIDDKYKDKRIFDIWTFLISSF